MPNILNRENFSALYAQGFIRVSVASPKLKPGDIIFNAGEIIAVSKQADENGSALVLMPELGLSSYALDDLFHQAAILNEVERQIAEIVKATQKLGCLIIFGAPIRFEGRLFNCGLVVHKGQILGVVPKTYLPNYREFYEPRYFSSAVNLPASAQVDLAGQSVPMGSDLLFQARDYPDFVLALEICEDLWTPMPPSSSAALAGATVIANLSASNATVGKSEVRHALCRAQSAQCTTAYLYAAAGQGESTTDLAWDGQAMIYENGQMLGETPRFVEEPDILKVDLDVEMLVSERMRNGPFGQASRTATPFRRIGFKLHPTLEDIGLCRPLARFPFVPSSAEKLDELCNEAYEIQVQGLAQRLKSSGFEKIVVGISGGLDSTQALLVAVRSFDRLGLPRKNIHAYTMPAFATSDHTKNSAWSLMRAFEITAEEVDVTPAALQMLKDIRHEAAEGKAEYDVTFENVQAGARTSLLFRLANHHNALVLGTGDLSELALGWCTYGVGDHMSHYNVNASVPKTLIQHLIRWVAQKGLYGSNVSRVLETVLATKISPELVPGDGSTPTQETEEFVGPYALQDFNLYHITRFGCRPSKVAFLAMHAWTDASRGEWPANIDKEDRFAYDLETIRRWLRVFLWRFFQVSQFKRSAVPNGPKISSGGSLSPRGDWRAPSDASARIWLDELDAILPPPAA